MFFLEAEPEQRDAPHSFRLRAGSVETGSLNECHDSYDVIVAGSGAGGAAAAYKLVKAGKRVLMIERLPAPA